MSSTIKLLPPLLINQIAAGEVVENPASVVKELVENAIDAGALRIHIEIAGGGHRRICVADDGCGMGREDAVLCWERHATSKIRTHEDLWHLDTMGFRGEALAAIAAVSKIELTTAHEGAIGTRVRLDGGKLLDVEPCGRTHGTTVDVCALFYNVEGRKKFQRGPSTSCAEIYRLVVALSLGHPDKEFILVVDGQTKVIIRCESQDFLQQILSRAQELLGHDFSTDPLRVHYEHRSCHIRGWIGSPLLHRPQKTGQYLYVNRRYVWSSFLSKVLRQAYATRLPEGRHPLCVLHIDLAPDSIDPNVHPQKKQVRFLHEALLAYALQTAARQAFSSAMSVALPPSHTPPWEGDPRIPQFGYMSEDRHTDIEISLGEGLAPISHTPERKDEQGVMQGFENREAANMKLHIDNERFTKDGVKNCSNFPRECEKWGLDVLAGDIPSRCAVSEKGVSEERAQLSLSLDTLHVVGVYRHFLCIDAASLVCPVLGTEGLLVVDLRAAYKRLMYEQCAKDIHRGAIDAQVLLVPILLHVPRADMIKFLGLREELAKIGFDIHPTGPDSLSLDAIPPFLQTEDARDALFGLIDALAVPGRTEKIATVAMPFVRCPPKFFLPEAATRLFRDLLLTEEPLFSPSGEKTMVLLNESRLQQFFNTQNKSAN